MTTAVAVSWAAEASAQEWATKMFEKRSHDFGTVARGAHAEYRFTFRNLYGDTVRVASVRSSCGCTQPDVTKRTIKPQETSEIIAVYNTRAFVGERGATLTVVFDQPSYAEVRLHVKGLIRRDVVLHPPSLNFGRVNHGSKAEQRIDVHYAGHSQWQIVDVRNANPHLETRLIDAVRGGGEVKYQLAVRLLDTAPPGYLKDQLTVVTNDRRLATFPIDVEGNVESELTVSPASIFFGVLQPGQSVTKRIVVRGRHPFRITRVECEDDCFQSKLPNITRQFHVIPVAFTAGKNGCVSGKIRIATDLKEGAVAEVSAHAQVAD